MRSIRSVDDIGNVLVAEAGCTLHEVQQAAIACGRVVGLDHGGTGSSHIGGNLATNAGGNNVIRYGMARDQVLGIEAVLPDGTIVGSTASLYKSNAGYDLRHLLMGSEGTLAVITAASLRMRTKPIAVQTAMLALESPTQALKLLLLARDRLGEAISSIELMSKSAVDFHLAHVGRSSGLIEPAPCVVLLECESTSRFFDLDTAFSDLLGTSLEEGVALTGIVAASVAQRREMWAFREGIPAAMMSTKLPMVRTDTAVPIDAVPDFLGRVVGGLLALFPEGRPVFFGHVGDGNIHVNFLPTEGSNLERFNAVAGEAYRLVEDAALSLGGTVSAEHGIGQTKREALLRMRAAAEITLMRSIKRAIDPLNLLNPGKIIANG
jgi:FAD/FMN-containing dehydrogenase